MSFSLTDKPRGDDQKVLGISIPKGAVYGNTDSDLFDPNSLTKIIDESD